MNGEIPSVPITTLAGVSSLVDLLPEMPLPTPLPQTLSNKSLLFHPRVAEEAQRLMSINDDNLIPQLIQSLSMTSSKHIDLKDQYNEMPLDHPNNPRLLAAIIHRKPDVFKGKHEQVTDWSQTHHQQQSQQHQGMNQQGLYGMNNVSGIQQAGHGHVAPISSGGHGQGPMASLDLVGGSHQMNNDGLHNMMPGLDFMTGLQQDLKADRTPDHPIYNRSSSSAATTSPGGSGTSPFGGHGPAHGHSHGHGPLGGYPPQQGVPNHNSSPHPSHSKSHLQQQPPSYPPQQYPQLQTHTMSPTKGSTTNTANNTNNTHSPYHQGAASRPHPNSLMEAMGAAGNPFQQQVPRTPSAFSAGVNVNIHNNLYPQQLSQIMGQNVNAVTNAHDSSSLSIAKISMNVPILKLENMANSNSSNRNSSEATNSNANHTPVKSEPILKLERMALDSQLHPKVERKDSLSTGEGGLEGPTTPSRSARKTSTANATNSKMYRDDSSEDEGDAENEDSPSKGRKGKIFKSKETLKDKRKKRESKDSDFTGELLTEPKKRKMSIPAQEEDGVVDEPKAKVRRVERMLVPVLEKLGVGVNVLENNTYQRFLSTMGIVLESIDYADAKDFEKDEDSVPSELLISKSQLNELCTEAAKLKALGAMEAMPTEKIVRLLTLLEINIRDGCKVTPLADPDEEDSKLIEEFAMDSISRGVVASLTALHILTSRNMPKRAYQEDLMDRIVVFSKFQLQNTVFPKFDPVYRVDKRSKGDGSSNKKKRAHAREVREKAMLTFYTKMHETVSLLAELLNVQVLTDTTVLHLSTLGVSPFFVENVPELQLAALKLVTGIFANYEKHRRLLLDDILASIARLPSSKRGLRTFKLSSGSDECIQMLTALVLQLIQCVTHLPEKLSSKKPVVSEDGERIEKPKQSQADIDILVSGRFDTALRTAGNFLHVFLSKCGNKSEDCDYRILFENFVQDLLSTVNKPEWPAAELLLSLLGNLLIKNIGNKGLEVSMRVASLEYLGVAAARLRKDAVSAQKKLETIDRIISDIRQEEDRFEDGKNDDGDLTKEQDKIEFLQRLLLDYLAVNGKSDPALMQSRHFYICSWWKNAQGEIAKSIGDSNNDAKENSSKRKKKKKKSTSSGEDSELSDDSDIEEIDEAADNSNILALVEKRRKFLLSKVRPFSDPLMTSRKTEVVQTFVDYQHAELITRYLASKRPFSASFDFFLKRILSVSSESTVAIRTKALKCLTMVVEADPKVLAINDMQLWVQHSFLDQSTSVREAAVDLVGKYVLSCPELIEKYYDILSLRILDTGVSVRKRVIKIMRDICLEHPTFSKVPEICVKMIRRVNDEDGIRKLVMEVFQNMWFSPVREEPLDKKSLLRKVSNITEVVASCEKVGLDFFEQLLLSLFRPKDDKEDVREKVVNPEPPKVVLTASTQIVNCLVEHVLRLEENPDEVIPLTGHGQTSSQSQRFVACVSTLYLFAKIRPQLLVNHAIILEGYLSMRSQNAAEVMAIANIASILELVVPLLVNPADSFLSQLEEDCVKLIFKHDKSVIESSLACLGAVVNKITKNYALVRDVFRGFQSGLFIQTKLLRENPNDPKLVEARPRLRRAIYTVGMILRYFDFLQPDVYGDLPAQTVQIIFTELLYLMDQPTPDLPFFSLQAVGHLCIRHYDFMLGEDLKTVYQSLLTSSADIKLKTQALCNIQLYLTEEENRMIKQDQEFQKSKDAKMHDIKEMGDVTSGMASTIVQIYLKQILEAFLHREISVRLAAVRVIQLVLQQGLVHPIQIVPYLICMSTDDEPGVSTTADKQLQEMEKKHPQFLQSQVLNGLKLSLALQRILKGYIGSVSSLLGQQHGQHSHGHSHLNNSFNEQDLPLVRGYRVRPKEQPTALNGFLYSLLRSAKPQRRAIALSLLKQFDDNNKARLSDLLYYCDNLAYFPYQVIDEPLFVIHHVDIMISVTGSNLLQSFKESLLPAHPPLQIMQSMHGNTSNEELLPGEILPLENGDSLLPIPMSLNAIINADDDDDDDDMEAILNRIPHDTRTLEECIISSQGCLLLLMLKQHLKESYGITDTKITSYSPSDASKTFERPVNRKNAAVFDPKCTLANLSCPPSGDSFEGRKALVEQYIHFKQLMLRIDPEEADEEGEQKPVKLKIDQNLFTYSNAKAPTNSAPIPQQGGITMYAANAEMPMPSNSTNAHNYNYGYSNANQTSQYAVISNSPAKQAPEGIPKLKIVPLAFPGSDQKKYKVKSSSSNKEHHHHHHKHKKSKHKKKKKHAISDDSDSDNSDDPDFRI